MDEDQQRTPTSIADLALTFLRLGTTAFGGPAAHIALMEEEFVRRRQWLTHEEFLDMIGAANLVPGPSSTEVAIHVGYRRAGVIGLVLAGICFIIPAALIVSALAWAYVRYGSNTTFQSALYGIKPVVIAIVAQAIWNLGRKGIASWMQRLLFLVSGILAWLGIGPLYVLLGSGFISGLASIKKGQRLRKEATLIRLLATIAIIALAPITWESLLHHKPQPDVLNIFLYFLKMGAVIYGSGYVLLAFLQRDLVTNWQWLTKGQLFDAIAVGQFTPGPVFTTATFIGYVLDGPVGALVATLGIFIPAFFFVAVSGRILPKLRETPLSANFLNGINAAALALMSVVLIRLGIDAIVDIATAVILVVAAVALIRFRINSALLILVGGCAGAAITLLR